MNEFTVVVKRSRNRLINFQLNVMEYRASDKDGIVLTTEILERIIVVLFQNDYVF